MTEAEWLVCTDPFPMLGSLPDSCKRRKWKFCILACGRRLLQFVADPRLGRMIDAAEGYLDGTVNLEAYYSTTDGVVAIQEEIIHRNMTAQMAGEMGLASDELLAMVAMHLRSDLGVTIDYNLPTILARLVRATTELADQYSSKQSFELVSPDPARLAIDTGERITLASLLREVFGNPFRPVEFSPEWRTPTALAVAQGIYDDRDFSAMPILADALMDSGCFEDDILNHCRLPGEHVRGCWVVDLALGKE